MAPPKPSLRQLTQAFEPAFAAPPDIKTRVAGEAVRETASAVHDIMERRGLSGDAAVRLLKDVAGEIQTRDRVLSEARRRGLSRLRTLGALTRAGVRPELLRESRAEFMLPGQGRVISTGLPGGERRLRQAPPTPTARPSPRRPAPTPAPPRRPAGTLF